MFSKKVQVLTETVQRLLQCHAEENLRNILLKAHPADIALCFGQLPEGDSTKIFSLLSGKKKGLVLSELSLTQVKPLLERLGPQTAADILSDVSPDDVADILEKLPEEFSNTILARLRKEEAEEVGELIHYRPDTAGGIMSPQVFALLENLTVREAIGEVQKARDVESVFYVYVVNDQNHLVGVLSLKKLLLASPDAPLSEVMDKDPIRVRESEDQEEVARVVSRYNYLSIPVVDASNKLVGVITVDDVIDVIREEATEDILRVAGVEIQTMERISFRMRLTKKIPHFFISLFFGILASEVIGYYFRAFPTIGLVVGFLPLLLGIAGGTGTQSMAIIVSGFAEGKMSKSQVFGLLRAEIFLAAIVGLIYALFLAGFVLLRYQTSFHAAFALGGALMMATLLSTLLGILFPLAFQKMGGDPSIATGPFVTSVAYVFSIWIYFALCIPFVF